MVERAPYLRQLGTTGLPLNGRVKRAALLTFNVSGDADYARYVWPDLCTAPSASGVSGYTTPYSENDSVHRVKIDDGGGTYYGTTQNRAKFALPSSRSFKSGSPFTSDLFSNGDVGVVYMTSDNVLRWMRVSASTWTITQDQSISTNGDNIYAADLSISDGDVPVVVTYERATLTNSRNHIDIYVRRTDTTAWQNTKIADYTTENSAPAQQWVDVSVASVMGGTATARNTVIAASGNTQAGTTTDHGLKIWSCKVNETTGAVSVITLRQTYFVGDTVYTARTSPVKSVLLFRSATNQVALTYGRTTQAEGCLFAAAEYSWNGTTWTELMSPQSKSLSFKEGTLSASYGSDTFVFYYSTSNKAAHWIAKYDRAAKSVAWYGGFYTDEAATGVLNPVSGVGRNAGHADHKFHPVLLAEEQSGYYQARAGGLFSSGYNVQLTEITPKANSTVNSSTPVIAISPRPGTRVNPQQYIKGVWQFSTTSAFTTYVEYVQPDSAFKSPVTGLVLQDILPEGYRLAQGTWYVRAHTLAINGAVYNDPWPSGSNLFTVTHIPVGVPVSPNDESIGIASGATSAAVEFEWQFTDVSNSDEQTAYQIYVYNANTGSQVYTTGQVSSAVQSATHTLPQAAITATELSWGIKVWDTDGVSSSISDVNYFSLRPAATVSITSPTNGGTVSTAVPSATFTITIPSEGTTVTKAQVIFKTSTGSVVHSGEMSLDVSSTQSVTYTADVTVFTHLQNYTVEVVLTDIYGMITQSAVRPFSASFILPANPSSPAVSDVYYNTENAGYVGLSWTDTARDANFYQYTIYRKADLIDGSSNVVEEGVWEPIHSTSDLEPFTFNDYYAPSGHKVNYKFVQEVNRFGSIVPSTGTVIAVYPASDGYWLIEAEQPDGSAPEVFKLSLITDDQYSDEYEEAEMIVIGRGRHLDRGEYLGVKGTLTAQIRDNGGTTARQKKLRLEEMRSQNRNLVLRNPFGDIFNVSIGNLSISRIAGVGLSEYCDVQIPYSEVSE